MSKIHIRDFLAQYYVADDTQTGFTFEPKEIKFYKGKDRDPINGDIESLPVCWFKPSSTISPRYITGGFSGGWQFESNTFYTPRILI